MVHRLAREASRELVAVLCFRNAAAAAAVERILPAGLTLTLRSPAPRQAGGGVNLFDAGVSSGSSAEDTAAAAAPPGTARAPVPSTCNESMFTSPRARVVHAAPAATAAPGKSPKKQPQQKQAPGGPPGGGDGSSVISWLSTTLWSGDADVPVALGRSGCLWWDAALCSPAASRAQRQAIAAKVKVAWFGVEPQARAEHTGPTAAALGSDSAPATAAADASTEAAPPPPPPPAPPTSSSRYEPTIFVVQVQ